MTESGRAALVELTAVLGELESEELEVMLYIARRLHGGQRDYGALNLAIDNRDFLKEAGAELGDEIIYGALDRLQKLKRAGRL